MRTGGEGTERRAGWLPRPSTPFRQEEEDGRSAARTIASTVQRPLFPPPQRRPKGSNNITLTPVAPGQTGRAGGSRNVLQAQCAQGSNAYWIRTPLAPRPYAASASGAPLRHPSLPRERGRERTPCNGGDFVASRPDGRLHAERPGGGRISGAGTSLPPKTFSTSAAAAADERPRTDRNPPRPTHSWTGQSHARRRRRGGEEQRRGAAGSRPVPPAHSPPSLRVFLSTPRIKQAGKGGKKQCRCVRRV